MKRCCGISTGPSEEELAKAFLSLEGRRAAVSLARVMDGELDALWEELSELPARDLSLLLKLPDLMTGPFEQLCEAVESDDPDMAEEVFPVVLDHVDTPLTRAALARSVAALRDAGRVRAPLAAVAIVDLSGS